MSMFTMFTMFTMFDNLSIKITHNFSITAIAAGTLIRHAIPRRRPHAAARSRATLSVGPGRSGHGVVAPRSCSCSTSASRSLSRLSPASGWANRRLPANSSRLRSRNHQYPAV